MLFVRPLIVRIVQHSRGGLTPNQWASRVADAYQEFEADAVVAEANQGGEMVRSVLLDPLPNACVKLVHASRGKITRAGPAATLYERDRVHHVGVFAELEDQMCNYEAPEKARPHGRAGLGAGRFVSGEEERSAED